MNAIETRRLSLRYGRTEALRDLDWTVPAGCVCGLLGPNGAGKSTTIKILLNLLRPSAGEARVLGIDSRRLGERELAQIGYVADNQQLPLWMTVRELLDFCRPFYPTWDRELERRLLAEFELPLERKLKQLSRGMLMKASLLSSLAYRPKLLLLDEPFGGLDPLSRHEFIRGVLEAGDFGDWTVLISSHDVEEIERLADRLVFLQEGRLQFEATTESLLARFRRIELTLPAASAAGTPAGGWLEWERSGSLGRFVEPHYRSGVTEAVCRERFAGAEVAVSAMSLREIFIVLAREQRRREKGAKAA
ncbi:MAG: ABC transporter ATP-binding protein [Verrucomicrobia bacterium]|nr:ABC transporter ATP-binding protein [Verrucomicrobiota bacterium]